MILTMSGAKRKRNRQASQQRERWHVRDTARKRGRENANRLRATIRTRHVNIIEDATTRARTVRAIVTIGAASNTERREQRTCVRITIRNSINAEMKIVVATMVRVIDEASTTTTRIATRNIASERRREHVRMMIGIRAIGVDQEESIRPRKKMRGEISEEEAIRAATIIITREATNTTAIATASEIERGREGRIITASRRTRARATNVAAAITRITITIIASDMTIRVLTRRRMKSNLAAANNSRPRIAQVLRTTLRRNPREIRARSSLAATIAIREMDEELRITARRNTEMTREMTRIAADTMTAVMRVAVMTSIDSIHETKGRDDTEATEPRKQGAMLEER